jgi:hypothetical protein
MLINHFYTPALLNSINELTVNKYLDMSIYEIIIIININKSSLYSRIIE